MAIRVPKKPADAYQHGNLRAALIQAGLRLLSEGGVGNLSLRGAAQLAGVSHAAPYRHFADKDELVAAIAEEGFHALTASLRQALAASSARKASDRLAALATGYVGFAVQHPSYLRVIFGGVVDKDAAPPSLKAAADEAFEVLRGEVVAGLARGELRGGDADELALACWSMVHGFGMLLVDRALPPGLCERVAAEATTRAMVGMLGRGIAAR
jgi:AcrR family transcriptional regulator